MSLVVHDVLLYSGLDIVVISGEDVCCSVAFGILISVYVCSVMWSELMMPSAVTPESGVCVHISDEDWVWYSIQSYACL